MEIIGKIESRTAGIGIIGLGYVGLPLALAFSEKGFNVLGFDKDKNKIQDIKAGKSYIKHINEERIQKSVTSGKFNATNNFSKLTEVDAIIICVPTPLNKNREPDMSYIVDTANIIQQYLRKGQLVTLESTTYPGTTNEILLPLFENAPNIQERSRNRSKLVEVLSETTEQAETPFNDFEFIENYSGEKINKFVVGEDFYLAFSPEREDPNNLDYRTETIPKVVGGITPNCLLAAQALYNQIIVKTIPVSSAKAAEAAKLLENIYRCVNIAVVNELKMVFDRMNIDIWEVINAATTKPFGYHPFYPGPGLGGHCIPIDPFYLTWKAREYELNTKFIELAGEINTHMPNYVVEKAQEILNYEEKTLKGSRILILGAAYKKNIDDLRESPSLKLISIFLEKGAEVDYNDPFIPALPVTRKYQYNMLSVDLTRENLQKYDLVVLSTDHDKYDYKFLSCNSKLILDTRNAFERNGIKDKKIFKA